MLIASSIIETLSGEQNRNRCIPPEYEGTSIRQDQGTG